MKNFIGQKLVCVDDSKPSFEGFEPFKKDEIYMQQGWIHFKIWKYEFRMQTTHPNWIGIFYPLPNGLFRDITIGFWYIRKQDCPF